MLICKYPMGGSFPVTTALDHQQCAQEGGTVVDDGTGSCNASVAPGLHPSLGSAGVALTLVLGWVVMRIRRR